TVIFAVGETIFFANHPDRAIGRWLGALRNRAAWRSNLVADQSATTRRSRRIGHPMTFGWRLGALPPANCRRAGLHPRFLARCSGLRFADGTRAQSQCQDRST